MIGKLCFCLFILCCGQGFGAIYHLNETEYERLPKLFDLDNYEKCMEDPGGVYCVVNFDLYTEANSDLYTLIQEYSEFNLKHYNYSVLDRGVCVMSTCGPYAENASLDIHADLRGVLEKCLNKSMFDKYELMARLNCVICEKAEDKDKSPLDSCDYIFLGVVIIITVLNIIGSYGDIFSKEKEQINKKGATVINLLSCFSVPENFKRLITVEQSDPRANIFKNIHALRYYAGFLTMFFINGMFHCLIVYNSVKSVIVLFFIVHAHVTLIFGAAFNANPHTFEKAYESTSLRISFSGMSIVQIFFFFTGVLLTYFTQVAQETHKLTWKMIPKIILHRWWRLTPSAAMLVSFSATWMRHLSSGPLWHTYITHGVSGQCRRFFWAHIFYFNNYIPEDTLCAFQTWYIAADMQIFTVGIILHFAIMNRSKRFKILTLISALLLSMAVPALHIWWQDLDAFAMQKPELYRTLYDANLRHYHTFGHNNLSSFFVGLAAGYLVYFLQQQKIEYPNCKIGNIICWCAILMYVLLTYCGSLYYIDGPKASLGLRMLYAGTNRALVGCILAFWILGVTLKFNGMSTAIMEWTGWVVPSRLSYSVYLLHNIFVELCLGIRTQLTTVSFFDAFLLSVGVFVCTYAIAVPFHLFIEAPAARLLKITSNQKTNKKMD